MGTAVDVALPDHWSATENCVWKTPLPGPGGSSPIVVGDRVFLTYYSGYAVSPDEPGAIESLARHLICVNLSDGKVVWDKGVEAVQPEKPYDSFTKLHGYASLTPASDGSAVYAFFGARGSMPTTCRVNHFGTPVLAPGPMSGGRLRRPSFSRSL